MKTKTRTLNARTVAVQLLSKITLDGKLMAELTKLPDFKALPAADRARAQRLALDTLRGLERIDRILDKFMSKKPPDPIWNILRVASYELCTGAAAHGVVNEAVNTIAKDRKFSKMKGLANAVLRKVATQGPEQWAILRPSRLPRWLRDPLKEAYGAEVVSAIEKVQANVPPVDLTPKSEASAQELADTLGGEVLLGGSVRVQSAGQISKLAGFEQGDWWVQDAAAALAVRLLGGLEGKTALDLCAAPGGKTLQLCSAGAEVTAVDVSEHRLKRLNENLERVNFEAEIICADAFSVSDRDFDIVLLDAPCSATGTMRRHPDLPYAKTGDGFRELFSLQADLLDHASTQVKPDGQFLYCTCSLLPDEGEVQIEAFLKRNTAFELDPRIFDNPIVRPEWIEDNLGIRLRTDFLLDAGGMDGFFISLLRRK